MAVDRGASRRRQVEPEGRRDRRRGRRHRTAGRSGVSWTRVGSGSRSRSTARLLWSRVPTAARRRSRRRLVSHRGRWSRSSADPSGSSAGSPRAPRGPRYPRAAPVRECGRYGPARAASTDFIHEPSRCAADSWITRPVRTRDGQGHAAGRSGDGVVGERWPSRRRGSRGAGDRRDPAARGAAPAAGQLRGVRGEHRRHGGRPAPRPGSAPAGPGRTSTKLEPVPGRLATSSSPSMARARSRAMGRPRPVPVIALVVGHPIEPFEDPGAVRRHRCPALRRGWRATATGPSKRPLSSTAVPSPPNLRALAARFVTICSTRRRSPVAARSRGGAVTCEPDAPRRGRWACRLAATASSASATENGPLLQRHRPGLEPGQLQQVADQRVHRGDDRPPALEELALDIGVVDPAVEDQVEIARQAGQRRAQLVGHGRDEAGALGLGRRAGPGSSRSVASASVTRARATAACRARAGGRRSGDGLGVDRLGERRTRASPRRRTGWRGRRRRGAGRGRAVGDGAVVRRRCPDRDGDGGLGRGRAPRATPGSGGIEPGREGDRRRRGRRDPTAATATRRAAPSATTAAVRAPTVSASRSSSPASRASGPPAGRQDVERAGQQPRSSWAMRSASRRELARRSSNGGGGGDGGRGDRQARLVRCGHVRHGRALGGCAAGIPRRGEPRRRRRYRPLRPDRDSAADRPAERPPDDVDDLVDVLVGLTALGGGPDATLDVVLEDEDRERIDGGAQGGGLLEDVDAVLLALDHPGDAPDLALHARQAAHELGGVLGVAVPEMAGVGRRRCDPAPCGRVVAMAP